MKARARLLALLLTTGTIAVTPFGARAEEVPPSPVPPPASPISMVPDNLSGKNQVDGVVVTAQGGCGLVFELVGGGRRVDVCSEARPESHCKTIRLDPNITAVYDTIKWRPYIDATDCYIRRGATLDAPFKFRITSSRTGDFRNYESSYTLSSDSVIKHMNSQYDEYSCDRTLGTADMLTFQWQVSAGGADESQAIEVPCN